MGNLSREALAHYLDYSFKQTEASATWEILGDDIDDMSVDLNPDTETKKNILGQTKTTDNGYEPSMDADTYYANPDKKLYPKIRDIAMKRLKGADCKTLMLEVLVEDTSVENHLAYVEEVMVKPQSYGGDTSGVNIPFKVSSDGKRTEGLAVQKDYAASLDKTAKSTKKATKAAKDYLSPLDEINRYTTNKDTDTTPSGSGANGTPISKMFEEVPIDAPPIFEKIKDVLGQIFQPFKEAWEREGKNTIDAAKYALSELGALAKSVGSSMLEVWTNGTGTQILSTMLQIAQGLLTTVGNIARQLDIAWNKNAVGTAIIQAIADAFQKVLDIINRLVWDTAQWAGSLNFYPLLNSIKNLFESMSPLIEAIGSFLERLYTNIILPMLTWLIESCLPALINVLAGLFNFLGEHQWIVDAIGTALVTAFATSKIVPLIATISSAVLGFAGHIGTLIDILKGGGGLIGVIGQVVSTFGIVPIAIATAIAAIILIATHWNQLKAVMLKLMDWIKGVFATDWHAQFGVFGDVVEAFLNSFKGIFNSIKQICSGFVTFLKGVFTGNVNMALKGILNILRGAANLIYSIFKAPVNMVIALFNGLNQAIINAINGLVDGLNHIKVPDWVPGIGGKGINLSHANYTRIPYLAQGAVIPAGNPFLAVLGDQTKGNNLEMPENLLRKIVSEESGKGTGMIKLVVNLDSRTVLEQLINTAKEMQMSNGQNVFELGR